MDAILKEPAKVINERTDYGEGYEFNRFGFCIGDRIFMVGSEGYGVDSERAKSDRAMCQAIVDRWNDSPDYKNRVIPDMEHEIQAWKSRAEHANRCDEQRSEMVLGLRARLAEIRSKFPASATGYQHYAQECHRIATESLKN